MRKVLVILILLVIVLVLPKVALAITLESMAMSAANSIFKVGIAAVVICWVVAGILFLSASGSPERLGAAKKALFAAIIGTVLVVIAASAINIISQAIGA